MTLKFSAGNHQYSLDGKKVQGVTTILGAGIPKPALPRWAAKSVAEHVVANHSDVVSMITKMGPAPSIAALSQVPWQTRDDAGVKGTEIHALAEEILHGKTVKVPERLSEYVKGYTKLLDDFGMEPILSEVSVANRKEWYAGRLDAVVKMRRENWLLDWKTSKGVYGETALQTAAYANAEFYVVDEFWDDEKPLPKIERIGVVHITDSGSHLYDLGDPDAAFAVFRHVKYLANKVDWIKGLIKEPMNASVV